MSGLRETSVHELTIPIYRAVMLSMTFTGWTKQDGSPAFTHDDYDEAMAAVSELARRAKTAEPPLVPNHSEDTRTEPI